MYTYASEQWVLLFMLYCLIGWVWECCWVSAHEKRWVNRGFMHGPVLPIYGSGAVIILHAALPFRENGIAVFLLGMTAANVLELIVGAAMQRILHMRYWDYTQRLLNYRGYICLRSSLCWGVFSVLLMWGVHPPLERLILWLPIQAAEPLAGILTAAFTIDFISSARSAMDVRQLIHALTTENEALRTALRRAEIRAAFADDELRRRLEAAQVDRVLLLGFLDEQRQAVEERADGIRMKRAAHAEQFLRRKAAAQIGALDDLGDAVSALRSRIEENGGTDTAMLDEAAERIRARQTAIRARSAADYRHAMRLLHAYPTARAGEHEQTLGLLRKLIRAAGEEGPNHRLMP